jgi:hypothetical protein
VTGAVLVAWKGWTLVKYEPLRLEKRSWPLRSSFALSMGFRHSPTRPGTMPALKRPCLLGSVTTHARLLTGWLLENPALSRRG